MGEITLKFNTPEEQETAEIALKSREIYGDLFDLREKIRRNLKDDLYVGKDGVEVGEEIYKDIWEIVQIIER